MPPTRVVVVGAGMSGLATAAKLVEESDSAANFDVTIVEASSYVGGRVRVDHQWSDIGPIDMGGEFIHGENSILMTMAKEHDWETLAGKNGCAVNYQIGRNVIRKRDDYGVFLDNELVPLWDTRHEVMAEALKAWEEIQECGWRANQTIKRRIQRQCPGECTSSCDLDSEFEEAEDCAIADKCDELGVSEGARSILKCVIAQTDGGCWNDFGLADFCEDWPYGEIDSRFVGSYYVLLKHYLTTIHKGGGRIQVSSPVFAVEVAESEADHPGMVVHLRRAAGNKVERLECDHVVVTVPLTVLQKRTISFRPPLPDRVQHAVDSLPMYSAVKVCMRFTRHFWPDTLTNWVCNTGVLSQYWCNRRSKLSTQLNDTPSLDFPYADLLDLTNKDGFVEKVKRSDVQGLNGFTCLVESDVDSDEDRDVQLLCGFATAEVAEAASKLEAPTLVRKVLKQLDDAFRTCTRQDKAASGCFQSALVCNWSRHPHVLGGYSAPAVGGVALRPCLSEPVYGERLLFAGEATHRQPSSVQAAVETGIRAALTIRSHVATSATNTSTMTAEAQN
ncbi:lysine-specific histone demethylase 2-like isoform X2 [Sycon ciliatum]|uniref:lysine-specific histone demethylase 2-like isoform X2 n=1 Tax=Sycon ciliatum TaxID=27933 RepID=UPI0031F60416